jgi:pantoate--beta-alanine ligase
MQRIVDAAAFREHCERARAAGKRVGFVPTMGGLHQGHLSLVRVARERADHVVVSIFVNPTQFGPNEDLDAYPRTVEADCAGCEAEGAATVFLPTLEMMYPAGDQTRVRLGQIPKALCGTHRPEHFEGVATVVTKLLSLVGPCVAVFGRKDYQQWRLIERLVADLFLPVEVVGAPIVREPDGLALSSRNRYLSAVDRERAVALSGGLSAAVRAYERGEREVAALRREVSRILEPSVDSVDYVTVADAANVAVLDDGVRLNGTALLAVAARLGATRLIDNVVLGSDPAPRQEP